MTEPSNDNNILGVDPVSDQLEDYTPPEQEQQTAPSDSETSPQQSSETNELESLRQKARLYDMMDNDPQLVSMINDYYSRKNVQSGQYPSQNVDYKPRDTRDQGNAHTEGTSPGGSEIEVLKQHNEQLRNMLRNVHARQQIIEFSMKTPDFEQYREDMGKLIKQHPTYTLEEAYDQVKRTRGAQAATPNRPPSESAEIGRPVAGTVNRRVDASDVANPRTARNMDEAIEMAWKLAQAQNRG